MAKLTHLVITALKDEQGRLLGFSKITRDLTERKKSEENARRLAEETAARQVTHQERERLRTQFREGRLLGGDRLEAAIGVCVV